mmetsp:Transcript_31272/g.81698  ORF Transcript_31272/g.81698 Transcript_31272/m.81698 type:complete len:316 (-) Transcript_31272:29-976(-)
MDGAAQACLPCEDELNARLCKVWARGLECRHRGCPFRHSTQNDGEERRVQRAKEQRRLDVAANLHPDDPHGDEMFSHGGRFIVMSHWLMATFGMTNLKAGAGVIDVAGGRAGLSFELHCRCNVPCTLIEPRHVALKSNQKRFIKKHPENGCYKHIRCRFDEEFLCSAGGSELINACSVLIGMHSDEATEAIVEAAVRFSKPFAVVPCCVFPSAFPNRRRANGGTVRTYDEFCEWLREQAPGSNTALLPFAGRNRVIYRTMAGLPRGLNDWPQHQSLQVEVELSAAHGWGGVPRARSVPKPMSAQRIGVALWIHFS